MELAPSVLIAFSAGVYVGVLVMAMMFVGTANDDVKPRSSLGS